MKKLITYPKVKIVGQSFAKSKKHVVPSQSMSLREIITRFVKREALPVVKEGTFEDRFPYDLEKLSKEDRVIQDEVLSDISARMAELKTKMEKEHADHVKKQSEIEATNMDKLKASLQQDDPKSSIPKQP